MSKIPTNVTTDKAWQRIIREDKEKEYRVPPTVADITKAVCKRVSYEEAEKIIIEYEWLGAMGQGTYCYGIFFNDICGGVVCFGLPASLTAGDMFGVENRSKAICLERGACTWWAHPHSASKLISFAVDDMSKNTKYRIFFAYSDEDAGEIGTVYQACNWLFLGKSAPGGSQNKLVTPEGVMKDSRHIMTLAKKYTDEPIPNRTVAREILHKNGWSTRKTKPKSKYVIVKGNRREVKEIMSSIAFVPQNYPKRKVG